MSYTFNLNSNDSTEAQIAAVRDECDDVTLADGPTEGKDYFLSNERIARRLRDAMRDYRSTPNLIKMAAASCLDTLATNQVYVLKVGQTLGETRDGAKVSDAIRKHAASLRAEVEIEEKGVDVPGGSSVRRRQSQSGYVVRGC